MKVVDPDRLDPRGSLIRERVSLILEPGPFEFGQCLLGRPLYSLVPVLDHDDIRHTRTEVCIPCAVTVAAASVDKIIAGLTNP